MAARGRDTRCRCKKGSKADAATASGHAGADLRAGDVKSEDVWRVMFGRDFVALARAGE